MELQKLLNLLVSGCHEIGMMDILGTQVCHIERKNLVGFGGGQRSFKVTRNEILKFLKMEWKSLR